MGITLETKKSARVIQAFIDRFMIHTNALIENANEIKEEIANPTHQIKVSNIPHMNHIEEVDDDSFSKNNYSEKQNSKLQDSQKNSKQQSIGNNSASYNYGHGYEQNNHNNYYDNRVNRPSDVFSQSQSNKAPQPGSMKGSHNTNVYSNNNSLNRVENHSGNMDHFDHYNDYDDDANIFKKELRSSNFMDIPDSQNLPDHNN